MIPEIALNIACSSGFTFGNSSSAASKFASSVTFLLGGSVKGSENLLIRAFCSLTLVLRRLSMGDTVSLKLGLLGMLGMILLEKFKRSASNFLLAEKLLLMVLLTGGIRWEKFSGLENAV